MPAITLVLEGRVIPGKQQQFETFLREARPYYESIGDVTMRFVWSETDEVLFREMFDYATRDAYKRDDLRVKSDPIMQAYLKRWREFLDGEVRVSIWNYLNFDAAIID